MEDDLKLWREFAQEGRGISIGWNPEFFDALEIPSNFQNEDVLQFGGDIIYDKSIFKSHIEEHLMVMNKLLNQNQLNDLQYQLVRGPLASVLLTYVPFFLGAYKDEREYRCGTLRLTLDDKPVTAIDPSSHEIKDQNGRSRLIPTSQFDCNNIKEIWMGPNCTDGQLLEIEAVLKDYPNADKIKIVRSSHKKSTK
jgi:hypothetical protein